MRRLGLAGSILLLLGGCGSDVLSKRKPSARPTPLATSSAPAAVPAGKPPPEAATAEAAIHAYYAAINAKRYKAAWSLLDPKLQASLGGFAAYRKGYKATVRDTPAFVSAHEVGAGQTVAIILHTVDRVCGKKVEQRFAGTWQLHRTGGRWVATSVSITRNGGTAPPKAC